MNGASLSGTFPGSCVFGVVLRGSRLESNRNGHARVAGAPAQKVLRAARQGREFLREGSHDLAH